MHEVPSAALQNAPEPRIDLAYQAIVEIGDPVSLGHSPIGERRMIPILGGTFKGQGLRGVVLPGGADRQLVRSDGVRLLDALYEMQAEDGAIFTVRNQVKIRDGLGERRYAMSSVDITAPKGPHEWLNQVVFVGTLTSLMPARRAVCITVYKIL